MDIRNQGRGVHEREVPGLEKLKALLPRHWYGFTNLELATGPGQSREIDLVMVIEDRVLLVDLKDWNGKITAEDGRWFHNGRDMGPSPVEKIRSNARKIAEILKAHLRDRAKASPGGPKLYCPLFQGLVVQTGRADLNEISENERTNAFLIDDFIQFIVDPKLRLSRLSEAITDPYNPLTSKDSRWRFVLGRFFNASTGHFRPGQRRYASYRATSDHPTFTHRSDIFSEFEVEDENAGRSAGLLRRWDFSKAEARFQTEGGRHEIAGREKIVVAYLNDRSPEAEAHILQPKVDDVERSVGYWEIFDKRRRLKRLSDFISTESRHVSTADRVELSRQLLARVKTLHDLDAAHLDIGPHSVWLEAPSSVRLSHLFAAKFPEVRSLGEHRYGFLSTVQAPEDILGGVSDPKRRDCFFVGMVIHQLIFGAPPAQQQVGEPPEWDPAVDRAGSYQHLHSWFAVALAWEPQSRFPDAANMLASFNAATTPGPSSKAVLEGLERFRRWSTQRQIYLNLPSLKDIKSDDRIDIWLSEYEERKVVVKMWKRVAWGDRQSELPRLLAFLEKAEALRQSPPPACAIIRLACWLPDAIVLLQDFVASKTLEEAFADQVFKTETSAVRFIKIFAERVMAMHEAGLAHGDLKPSNIMIEGDVDFEPTLVDVLDLTAAVDGEVMTTAYAPPAGGDRFARDRFAVTKVAEEMFSLSGIIGTSAARIAHAIDKCRTGPPENATLLPLIEELDLFLRPRKEVE